MLPPDARSEREVPARFAAAVLATVLSACLSEGQRSDPIVIGPEALTVLAEDSLQAVYIDVADLGGSVAYLSATEPFVTIVNPAGQVTRQFGMPGEGPGEFRNPTSLDAQADTLYVWDVRQGAASMLDTLGRYLGRRGADASFGGVAPRARLDYAGRPGLYRRFGAVAVSAAYPNGVSLPGEQQSQVLLAFNDSGVVVDTAWASSLPASANQPAPQKPMQLLPIPVWARCSDSRLAVYDPVAGVSSLRTPEGVEIRRRESPADTVAISTADLRRYVAFHFQRLYVAAHIREPSSMAEEVAEWVRQAQIQGAYPSGYTGFTSVLCDRRDRIWLDSFSLEDSPLGYGRTWVVLSGKSGRYTVTLPMGFRLMLLTDGRGYGVLMDSTSAEVPAWVELPD